MRTSTHMALHPLFKKKRRRARVVGYAAIGTGLLGFALPLMPGFVLCIVGLSLLSFNSPRLRSFIALAHAKYPHLAAPFAALEQRLLDFFDLRTHTFELLRIPVRNGHTLSAIIEHSLVPNPLVAVLLHSASGTKESSVTTAIAEGLRARGYTVVRFDAYDGLGESGGAYPSFTATRFLEDLADTVAWVRTQPWSSAPLVLAGHSVGGTVILQYAVDHKREVERIVLFAPTLSGEDLEHAFAVHEPDMLASWRAQGVRPVLHPRTEEVYMQDLSFLEDLKRYDCTQRVADITMPVEIFYGTHDTLTNGEAYARFAYSVGKGVRITVLPDIEHAPTHHFALHSLTNAIANA